MHGQKGKKMGFVLLEREGWPGMVQLSFIERDEFKTPPAEAARILLEGHPGRA